MDDVPDWFVHTVQVETLQGAGAAGPVYSAPVAVAGFLDGKVSLVRNTDGEQVVAQSTFYCSLADGARFTPDSRVTLPAGRRCQVITVNTMDAGGLLDGVEHTAVTLT